MQVYELIELLEQYDGEQEVRLAFQPSWPLAFEVGQVIAQDEIVEEPDDDTFEGYHSRCDGYYGGDYCPSCEEQDETPDSGDEPQPIVWITEGGHPDDSPYAPKGAFGVF